LTGNVGTAYTLAPLSGTLVGPGQKGVRKARLCERIMAMIPTRRGREGRGFKGPLEIPPLTLLLRVPVASCAPRMPSKKKGKSAGRGQIEIVANEWGYSYQPTQALGDSEETHVAPELPGAFGGSRPSQQRRIQGRPVG